jgi:hypothetical protein
VNAASTVPLPRRSSARNRPEAGKGFIAVASLYLKRLPTTSFIAAECFGSHSTISGT